MSYHVSALCDRRRFGSATRKQIIMYLADKASDDGTGIWCSKYTIARHTELSLATVKRIIRDFLNEGILVAIGAKRVSQHGTTVVYRIALDLVDKLEILRSPPPAPPPIATEVTVNPVQPATATGVTVRHQPGSQRPPNNPKNHPMNPPLPRQLPRETEEADLQPIWEAYPSDRRRDREACRRHLAAALLGASCDELVVAAKAYAAETAEYTRSKVMFLDNWLRTGKWQRCVDEFRKQITASAAGAGAGEEALIANAALWIPKRSELCRHVQARHAEIAIERGLITLEQARSAGVMP